MIRVLAILSALALELTGAETSTTSLTPESASSSGIQKTFPRTGVDVRAFSYAETGARIRLVESGASRNASVVFVHGSPGNWEAWSSYLTNENLLSKARLIAVDRPGFGASDPGRPERSVKTQSDRIYRAFRELSVRDASAAKAVWIGHSYGGPVIARLAMDHPETVRGLLFIGASIDPDLEKVEWYQKLAAKPCVSRLLPKTIYVVNEEIFPLKGELQTMLPRWKEIRAPTTILHGTKDRLVPFANTAFARGHLVNAEIRETFLTNVDHFIPWTHRKIVENEILRLLDK